MRAPKNIIVFFFISKETSSSLFPNLLCEATNILLGATGYLMLCDIEGIPQKPVSLSKR